MYMAKIQEVLHATDDNFGLTNDAEPLEKVHTNDDYNVFATEKQHSEQPKSINDTYVVETVDSNVIPDLTDMCYTKRLTKMLENMRMNVSCLLFKTANLKLDVDDNKEIQKILKKANTSIT
ncbi:hypothetical protein Tco_0191883 [Tanacetum coccineum]